MRAMREPLERLLEDFHFFLNATDVRAMHVRAQTEVLAAVVGALAACEHRESSPSPILTLLSPSNAPDHGWAERTRELLDEHKDLRDAVLQAELELPVVRGSTQTGLAGFGAMLATVAQSIRAPLEGVILLLVPGAGAEGLSKDLKALLEAKPLASVRWVIVEDDVQLRPAIEALGTDASLTADVIPDQAKVAAELQELADNAAAAPSGAQGLAAMGFAGPGIAPPRRPHEGPETPPEVLAQVAVEQGVAAALTNPALMHKLRVSVLQASAAMAARDLPKALGLFREARDLCAANDLPREAVVYEMTMGAICIPSNLSMACDLFRSAHTRAMAKELRPLAARAAMGHGGALAASKRFINAAEAYCLAGSLAGTEDRITAIDAYRMAGQLYASERRLSDASSTWKLALNLAEGATPIEQMGSTAPDVALALAELCSRNGLTAQAESLRRQAAALSAGPSIEDLHPAKVLDIHPPAGAPPEKESR